MVIAKKLTALLLAAAMASALFSGCGKENTPVDDIPGDKHYYEGEVQIVLSDDGITADGKSVAENIGKVNISSDVIYYEDKDFYESGNPYGEGTSADRHTAKEAAKVTVVNITKAGYYRLTGKLSNGQIRVDLGKDADEDESAVVNLILDGLDINCDVAPAILFMNVYECDNERDKDTATSSVDTSNAGANVIIADGSTNSVEGAYVAKIFKDNDKEKKLWKQDAAFYSYMSMNINGEGNETGVLNITADNEGLGTELHLTLNSGNINIFSGNDGINTNKDDVSVTTINGGNLHIMAGLGAEGDGIDSNGWLVINGGTVVSAAKPISDAGLDSSLGSFVNGGTVIALGSTMDWAESDSQQVTMNLQFDGYKAKNSAIIVTREDGSVVFAYDPAKDSIAGSNIREYIGAVISCPQFATGETYNVYVGQSTDSNDAVTGSHTNGIYDVSTITVANGVQQAYTGTDVGFGGFGGGRPPQFNGERPQMDGEPPQFNGEMPQFDGEAPKFNGERPQMGGSSADILEAHTAFYMNDKVNSFSGVSDYTV